MVELEICPVCSEEFAEGQKCGIDIDLGVAHSGCLSGSPIVNLDTGEEDVTLAPIEFEYTHEL